METLTIKELAPYLAYELDLYHPDNDNVYKLVIINNTVSLRGGLNIDEAIKYNCKPLLRPLSDLTKPITHNGETFVPMEKLCNDFCHRTPCNPEFGKSKILMHADNGGGLKWWFVYHRNKMTFELSDDNKDMSNHTITQYEMFQKLFEWNFDVFGLIPRNLAIDINTIKIAL